jgi:hypothetical protein
VAFGTLLPLRGEDSSYFHVFRGEAHPITVPGKEGAPFLAKGCRNSSSSNAYRIGCMKYDRELMYHTCFALAELRDI